jgi:hypothetical protein
MSNDASSINVNYRLTKRGLFRHVFAQYIPDMFLKNCACALRKQQHDAVTSQKFCDILNNGKRAALRCAALKSTKKRHVGSVKSIRNI